jgi:hypothetical protein
VEALATVIPVVEALVLTVDAATVPGEEPAKPPLPTEVVPEAE